MRNSLTLLIICSCLATAARGHDQSLYPHPQSLQHDSGDAALSCEQLERELSSLEPLSYSYKPDFYSDPAHGAAIWGTVFWAPAAGYLAYSGLAEYYDHKRMLQTQRRMAVLRQLKARRRCFQY